MTRTLNHNSNTFTKKFDCVFVSDDLNQDGSIGFTVKKWISDYKKAIPVPIAKDFSNTKGRPWHPFYINRYISFSHFKTDITKRNLTFVSPSLWFDPYETVFFDKNLVIGEKHVKIMCICATYDYVDGEEAAWKRNDDKKDKAIRVSFRFEETCKVLSDIGKMNNCVFYISIVDYSSSKDILIKKNKPVYTSIDDYIRMMSFKRKAFAYENEIRLFAVSDNFGTPDNTVSFKLREKDYDNIIEKITLPPLNPFLREDERFKLYKKMQDNENLQLRTQLKHLLPNTMINQSQLYNIK